MLTLPRSSRVVPALAVLDRASSTNTELASRASEGDLAPFTTVVTDDQTAGRGRLDRAWTAPAGASLAISVILPAIPLERAGWIPLAAGLAMAETVAGVLPRSDTTIKWPNDVLVGGRKICGILAELLPSGRAVLGAGLNLGMTAEQLPVPTATSVAIEDPGRIPDADAVLEAYLVGLRSRVEAYLDAGCDAHRSGLHAAVTSRCSTIGRVVRIEIAGRVLGGTAVGLDDDGRLLVESAGDLVSVAAGDVVHVR